MSDEQIKELAEEAKDESKRYKKTEKIKELQKEKILASSRLVFS